MKEIMAGLRTNPPAEICGMKVTAVRDYKTGLRTANGVSEPTGLPTSDVLYFELENGNWVCVRPSGTEPKIKLYVNTNAADKATAEQLNADLRVASEALRAVVHGVDPGLKEGGIAGFPGIVSVTVIGEYGIHPRVGQQLGVAAEHRNTCRR